MKEYKDYSLLDYNTFGIDVKASSFYEYASVDELRAVLPVINGSTSPYLHIGGGSNLLFLKDFDGIILHSAIRGFELVGETETTVDILAGAAEIWDDFVAYAVARQWYGAENLSLIPGEVGASAVQNIGAYGVEIKDILLYVDTIEVSTGQQRIFTNEECHYAYRESIFKKELKGQYIVTHVCYRLNKQPGYHLDYGNIRAELSKLSQPLTLGLLRDTIISIRNAKLPDPKILGNAGSFFMNPIIPREQYDALLQTYPDMPHYDVGNGRVKVPAGWLIDRSGWKGRSLGPAGVHDRQALVLVNRGGATGADILRLAQAIIRSVSENFGITIRPEVNFIG